MQCNIDARGKAVRLVSGMASVLAGAALVILAVIEVWPSAWVLGVGIALLLVGGFQVFEGWCGWCVLRAMGFRTKI